MAFNDIEWRRHQKVVEAFVERRRPPPHIRAQVDLGYRLRGQSVELFEIRPRWDAPQQKAESAIAKATYVATQRVWKVYWQRADMKWHAYPPSPRVLTLEEFLAVVERDEQGCFFG